MTTGLEDIFGPLPVARCEICGSSLDDKGPERTCRNNRCVTLLCPRCQAAFTSYGPTGCGCDK